MANEEKDVYAELEAAVGRWNDQVARAGAPLADQVVALHDRLTAIQRVLASRRMLSSALVVARARLNALDQHQADRDPEVLAMTDEVRRTEQAFTDLIAALQQLDQKSQYFMDRLSGLYAEPAEKPAQTDVALEIPDIMEYTVSMPETPVPDQTGEASPASTAARTGMYDRLDLPKRWGEAGKKPMGAILVSAGVISESQLEQALSEQGSAWNRHLGAILVFLGFTDEETIAQALAVQSHLPFVRLSREPIARQAVRLIPERLAQMHTCMPLRVYSRVLTVALANPFDLIALEDLRLAANCRIEPVVATAQDIRSAIQLWYVKKS